MNILFVVYHDLKEEARSNETLQCLHLLGKVSIVTCAELNTEDDVTVYLTDYKHGIPGIRYLMFLMKALKAIKAEKPDVIALHDISLLIPYIRRKIKNARIIYDQSELHIDRRVTSLKTLLLKCIDIFDRNYIKKCDITIAASSERAVIMKDYFSLEIDPIVFDNVHRIDEEYDDIECSFKYGKYFEDDKFVIVYGGGIKEQRMTYRLMHAVGKLGTPFELIIAGATPEGMNKYYQIINDYGYSNINYVGFIPRNEWRYLLKEANVSFVAFAQDTLNNINCASGKMYESFFEYTPILASENPPLKRVCESFGIGISTDDYIKGLVELKKNYHYYKKNTIEYVKTLDYDSRIPSLAIKIKERLRVK